MKKKSSSVVQQGMSTDPVDRSHFDTERLGADVEHAQMSVRAMGPGYETRAMPTEGMNTDFPGRDGNSGVTKDWNKTRPKAPGKAK